MVVEKLQTPFFSVHFPSRFSSDFLISSKMLVIMVFPFFSIWFYTSRLWDDQRFLPARILVFAGECCANPLRHWGRSISVLTLAGALLDRSRIKMAPINARNIRP